MAISVLTSIAVASRDITSPEGRPVQKPPAALPQEPHNRAVRNFRPFALAAGAAIVVEIVGRAFHVPLGPATGLAATVAALVYTATLPREPKR